MKRSVRELQAKTATKEKMLIGAIATLAKKEQLPVLAYSDAAKLKKNEEG